MDVKILGISTNEGTQEDAFAFVGNMDVIQSTNLDVTEIMRQSHKVVNIRLEKLMERKRFEAFESVVFTFLLDGIPEVLAMILNSEEKNCAFKRTTEAGALPLEKSEKDFYNKWESNIRDFLTRKFHKMEKTTLHKMVRRTAGYGISIFAPTVTMVYSVNWRQLNRILYRIENFVSEYKAVRTNFLDRLVSVLDEFWMRMSRFCVKDLDNGKYQKLALFAKRPRSGEFGETFCSVYEASFACVAYSQLHSKTRYEVLLGAHPEQNGIYVPDFFAKDGILKKEWESDMEEISNHFPKGLLVTVHERGTIEDFAGKCEICLKDSAQPETREQTTATLKKYINIGVAMSKHCIVSDLRPYVKWRSR